MADIPNEPDDDLLGDWDANQRVGAKVMEMCERVAVAEKCCPGAAAKWVFELDGELYEVTVRVDRTA